MVGGEFNELEELAMAGMKELYTETVVDHATHPRNFGDDPYPDGYAIITGPCGDTMGMWLKVRANIIDRITFWADGCGPSLACGSMATEIIKGRSIPQALMISQDEILGNLGGLPEESLHCALLAANTVKEAIRDYLALKNEPWKRPYRKRC